MIKNKKGNQLGINSAADIIAEKLYPEAKTILSKLTNQEKLIKYKWFYFKPYNLKDFNFIEYDSLKELFNTIYYRNLKVENAEKKTR